MAIILSVIKASALLAAALAGARVLRGAPAATRHALWSVTFAALLALPVLDGALPALPVHVPAWAEALTPGFGAPGLEAPGLKSRPAPDETRPTIDASESTAIVARATGERLESRRESVSSPVAATRLAPVFDPPSIGAMARLVWLAGAAAAAGALLLSLLRVRRLTRTAADVTDAGWREAADAIGARLAIRRRARVLVSGAVRTPMAGGVWRPLIFVPADAASWTPERRDVVLAHELSHIAGRDPLRHVAARLAVACYWFHPLAWLAAKHASLAREQACDEAVLALGVRPSDYARVLLDLADAMAPPRRAAATLPMVERSLLETRLMAILDHGIRPSRLRQSFVPAAAAAVFAVVLAAAQPAARAVSMQPPLPFRSAAEVAAVPPIAPTSSVTSIASAGSIAAIPPVAGTAAPQTSLYTTCWLDHDQSSFSGYTNTDERGVIRERVGTSGSSQIIQQRFGDMRVCMLAEGDGTPLDRETPTAWAARALRVIIETSRAGTHAQLDILRHAGGTQTRWRVNDADRPFDATGQAWRDAVLAVLDRVWEISTLRGEASSLHGEISSLRGEESSLRGEISSLHGQISTMRGEQSSVRGEESTLRGEIATIQGQVSSLRGQISSERGSISSLEASRYGLANVDRERVAAEIKAHQDEIARLERELRDFNEVSQVAAIEKQIRALDADGKVAVIDDQIRRFDEVGKVAAIEKQIQALDADDKAAAIDKQIQALDVDRRSRQIETRLDEALRRLEQALAAIR